MWLKFTCDDDPHHGNDSLKKQAIKKANDLAETKISLELLPVGKADFDARKFYVDLVPEVDDVSSSAQRFEDLLSVVKKRVHKKRALARIRFFQLSAVHYIAMRLPWCFLSSRPGFESRYSQKISNDFECCVTRKVLP